MTDCFTAGSRKFLFCLEESDEETPFLTEQEQHEFETKLEENTLYHLTCLNYPKIKATIQVKAQKAQ